MPIVVTCRCGQKFAAQPHLAGKQVACPVCGQALLVPRQPASPAAARGGRCGRQEDPCRLPMRPPVSGRTAFGRTTGRLSQLRTADLDPGGCVGRRRVPPQASIWPPIPWRMPLPCHRERRRRRASLSLPAGAKLAGSEEETFQPAAVHRGRRDRRCRRAGHRTGRGRVLRHPGAGPLRRRSGGGSGWQEYTSTDGQFSVQLPSGVFSRKIDERRPQAGLTLHVEGVRLTDGREAGIAHAPLNVPMDEATFLNITAQELSRQKPLRRQQDVQVQGHPAKELEYEIAGADVVSRFFLAGGRFYEVTWGARRGKLKPEDYQKFFDSFRLLGAAGGVPPGRERQARLAASQVRLRSPPPPTMPPRAQLSNQADPPQWSASGMGSAAHAARRPANQLFVGRLDAGGVRGFGSRRRPETARPGIPARRVRVRRR